MFEGYGCRHLAFGRMLIGTCDCADDLNGAKGRVENGPFWGDVRFGVKKGNCRLSWRKEKCVVNRDNGVSEGTFEYVA